MQTLLCPIDIDLSKIIKHLLYFNMYQCGWPKWDDLHSFKGYTFLKSIFKAIRDMTFQKNSIMKKYYWPKCKGLGCESVKKKGQFDE